MEVCKLDDNGVIIILNEEETVCLRHIVGGCYMPTHSCDLKQEAHDVAYRLSTALIEANIKLELPK